MSNASPSTDVVVALTQTLYREARILDEGQYEDWLALLDDDIEYVATIRQDLSARSSGQPIAPHELSFFQEDMKSLQLRVAKIRTGLAQTENPPSRVVRLISNIEIVPQDTNDALPVHSAFLVYRQHRQRDVELLAGRRRDLWRRHSQGWRLAYRQILFAANILPVKSLPLFY